MEHVIQELRDRQKQTAGRYATFLWLGVGAYIFAVSEAASFVSWQAAVYFVFGMFAAALILGLTFYTIQQGVSKILVRVVGDPSHRATAIIQSFGAAIAIAEAVAVYYLADYVILSLLFPSM